ncbi:MAG: hypothetical protein ACK41S_08580 [Planctomycetota bacterium]
MRLIRWIFTIHIAGRGSELSTRFRIDISQDCRSTSEKTVVCIVWRGGSSALGRRL